MEKLLVSVILPVYNAEHYLKDAIDSIIGQTYKNLEIIIINDGSSDGSDKIIRSYSDKRIRYVCNYPNKGLIDTLNIGFSLASGVYIARMDADDIALPVRIERQVECLNAHSDITVLGSAYAILGTDRVVRNSESNEEIKSRFLYHNPIGHPTVMLRKSFFEEKGLRYDKNYPSAEDYELWVNASLHGAKFLNISDVLLKYRLHNNQISAVKRSEQECTEIEIKSKYIISLFNHQFTPQQLAILFNRNIQCDIIDILKTTELVLHLAKVTGAIRLEYVKEDLKKIVLNKTLKENFKLSRLIRSLYNKNFYLFFSLKEALYLFKKSIFRSI